MSYLGIEKSILGKQWIGPSSEQERNQEKLFQETGFPIALCAVLSRLKIDTNSAPKYLEPTLKELMPEPSKLKDMTKAAERILHSVKTGEKIAIFADYDVDGACSAALLINWFRFFNVECTLYVPDRVQEGFGPNVKALQLLGSEHSLIICVDCGTLSHEAIESEHQSEIIVLDHHQSEVKLPEAFSIINPNRLDDKSNLQYLCAAGVTFMFLISLNRSLRNDNWFEKNNMKEPNLINYLDLVSLGTVCDVVPLVGLNRAIVKQGLKVIRSKKNLGLKTLLDICKVEANPSIYHLGYLLGPRINAGGRVGKCSHGANLLLNKDPKDSFKIASELDQYNKERQILEKDLVEKILNEINKYKNDPVLILCGTNWHEGVIGIVASRLKDKFNKPVIIISLDDGVGKASARSIVGFDIGSVIIAATQEKILLKGGGHKMAAGFSIEINKIEMPILVGYNFLGPLSIFTGPIFQNIISIKSESLNFGDYTNNLTMGLQIGLRVEVGKFGLGFRFERGFTDNEIEILDDNKVDIKAYSDIRPKLWSISLTYNLRKKKL